MLTPVYMVVSDQKPDMLNALLHRMLQKMFLDMLQDKRNVKLYKTADRKLITNKIKETKETKSNKIAMLISWLPGKYRCLPTQSWLCATSS
jgi:hypothetical protein